MNSLPVTPNSGTPTRATASPTHKNSLEISPPLVMLLPPLEPGSPTSICQPPETRIKVNPSGSESIATLTGSTMTTGNSLPSRVASPGVSVCDVKDPLWWEETPIIAHRRKRLLHRLENGKATLEPESVDDPLSPGKVQAITTWTEQTSPTTGSISLHAEPASSSTNTIEVHSNVTSRSASGSV